MSDYRGQHEAPGPDYGHRMDRIGIADDVYPVDVMQWADCYGLVHDETRRVLEAMPTMVRVYRAVPDEGCEIMPGDWVALSREYAADHAHRLTGDRDGVVVSRMVPVGELWSSDSLEEWGWHH